MVGKYKEGWGHLGYTGKVNYGLCDPEHTDCLYEVYMKYTRTLIGVSGKPL